MCGTHESCDKSSTAPVCDPDHSICKCAESRDACTTAGETCHSGECRCGEVKSCENNQTAPYCNFNISRCSCSEEREACHAGKENCINGHCETIGKFIFITKQIILFLPLMLQYTEGTIKFAVLTFTVHCKWGDFGNWSNCSVSCGHGEETRMREIETAAANGGTNCTGSERETRPCTLTCPGMTKFSISF